ncbi:MAG: DUF2249 domain-containing protein [Verrucomicrobiota bacterium]|nr:DUF2249 domain-containing protein [Verrucomicrobiota bacterium]
MNNANGTILDVRSLLANGGCPFDEIMGVAAKLESGGTLTLIAPFEPVPLYAALATAGLVANGRAMEDGSWTITITRVREACGEVNSHGTSGCAHATEIPVVLLDLRELEPPEPMIRALERVASLKPGQALIALTRFRPVHLLQTLDKRGLRFETLEQADGTWETTIAL